MTGGYLRLGVEGAVSMFRERVFVSSVTDEDLRLGVEGAVSMALWDSSRFCSADVLQEKHLNTEKFLLTKA